MTAIREENLFGRLALHYGLLTRDQLAEALREQEREGHHRKIGEILIERGWLNRDQVEQLRRAQVQYQSRLADKEVATGHRGPGQPPVEAPGTPAPGSAPAGSSPAEGLAATAGPEPSALGTSTASLPPLTEGGAPDPGLVGLSSPAGTGPAAQVIEEPPLPQPAPAIAAPAPGDAGWLSSAITHSMPLLLELAVQRSASDLHIHTGLPVRLRVHGELEVVSESALEAQDTRRLLDEILTPDQSRALAQLGQIDFSYSLPGVGRFRANVYRQQNGTDGVFRVIPAEPLSLSDLGLPLDLARLANFHQGLVLLTGPTGCGKSSTLAALVRIVNEERRDHVITIEDPIEFVHRPDRCVVNQREVGIHTRSFARALRAALREDPDVIVVGELRDLETISLALTAAETGHLVLATLHTMNAINTINRLVGVFPPAQQAQIRTMVSESLRAVTSQRLARRADGTGRVPALEVMMATKAVGNLIRENKTFQIRSVLQTGAGHGMRSLDASLEQLVKAGTVTPAEARRHAEDPRKFPG